MSRWAALPAAFAILASAAVVQAASPVSWDYPGRPPVSGKGAEAAAPRDGRPAALKVEGRAEGVAIGESGSLTLSVPLRELFPGSSGMESPPLLWTAVLDDSGQLHLGAGGEAEVITIDRKGTAAEGVTLEDLGVRALAAAPGGDLYIGTFPQGNIYRMARGKDPEGWAEMDDRYIWSLALDAQERLYAGTGEKGIVYRITARGQKEVAFDSDQAHITALAIDPQGRLLAGTDPDGLLYRVGENGKAELLLDTDLREVSAVAVDPAGAVWAAAVSQEVIVPPRKPGERGDMMIEVTPAPDGSILEDVGDPPRKIVIDLAELLPAAARTGEGTMGRVYRLEPGRPPALVWKSDTERVYALAAARDGSVLFGTGGAAGGRIYRVDAAGFAAMLHQVRETQVTALAAGADGRIIACTSNPGRVYMLDGGSLSSGNYVSEVYDAGRAAQWGSIAWEADVPAGARVEMATRSGNRPVPDQSWSPWTPAYAVDRGSPIASPAGRYLQWRAELSRLKNDVMPSLSRVRVTLLPQNLAPTLSGLTLLGADEKAPEPGGGAGKAPPKGTRWIVWEAADPEQDSLSATVLLRRDGEEAFRTVAGGGASSPHALDVSTLEEGTWTLKVVVDDSPTNGPERALAAPVATTRIVVDRTAPTVEPRKPSRPPEEGHLLFEVQAMDALSAIARAEYAMGEESPDTAWRPLPCRDGICDTPSESFLLELLEGSARGRLRLRVVDTAGNATVFEPPAAPSR